MVKLIGDTGVDFLLGTNGADELHGAGGNDTLRGGFGGDSLFGDAGSDSADYRDSTTAVEVHLSGGGRLGLGYGRGGTAEGDLLIGIVGAPGGGAGVKHYGTDGANLFDGGAGADEIRAYKGADGITGGASGDTMWGGEGADTFRYSFGDSDPGNQRDLIKDFSHAQGDRIDLGMIFGPVSPSLYAFTFVGKDDADDPGEVGYHFSGNRTIVEVNADSDAAVELEIELSGKIDLVAGDFLHF